MLFNRFSINSLLIFNSFFISIGLCFDSANKTTFRNINNNTFIQNYFKEFFVKNNFLVNNKSDESFGENNETLSEILLNKTLNKTSNESHSNPTLFLRQLFKEIDENDQNVSVSESRTLSSWLGLDLKRFRRPQFKLKGLSPPFQGSPPNRNQPLSGPPVVSPQLAFPQFLSQPNSFPGPHDPDSIILPPSLFEESGIKEWLKFIENGGRDDFSGPEEYNSRPNVNREYSRMRRPTNHSPEPELKPIKIGEKPYEDNDEYYEESEESEEQNDEEFESTEDDQKSSSSSSSSSSNGKQTYDTSPRCDKFTSDICVDDFEYPEQAIVDEIHKRRELFELMYSEVRDTSIPLVDGIPRDVEESYNYDYYNDNRDPQPSSSGRPEKKSTSSKGFVCPSEVMYGKPKLARNKRGEWKVIVNAAEFTQTVRMEKCLKPNSKCNYISKPDFDSRCAQVHSYHRLLVFEKGKGFYIDTFRMPTACTCHVTRRASYIPSNSQTTNFKKRKPSPPLSNTLWSILGGPLPNEGSSGSQSQEIIRNQLNLLQQLKHFPQLSHITPDNVFQQLMDLQTNSDALKAYESPKKSNPMFGHQSDIDYILPSFMLNEGQINADRKGQPQMSRPLAQIHQSSGTTTLLNPNVNGAPVVQVIHVPVTSQVAAPNSDPMPVYKGKNPTFNDYNYLDASSLFYKPKQNSEEFLQTFGDDFSQLSVNSFRPLMLGMSSKTNSSLMSPHTEKDEIKRESDSKDTKNNSDSDEDNKKRKVMVESTLNKKINFSYHPILEYLSN